MRTPCPLALLAVVSVAAAATAGAVVIAHRGSGSKAPASGPPPGPYRGTEPPPGLRLTSFDLPRSGGGVLRSSTLRGRVVLVTFVDSACKEKCPIIVGMIGRALPRLSDAERGELVAVAFSVDPRVDTPAHVRRFLAERGARGIDYLVGSVREMRPVWKKFAIVAAVDTGSSDVHSADVRIFDRRGIWVSTLHAGVDLTPANLVHDVREALRTS